MNIKIDSQKVFSLGSEIGRISKDIESEVINIHNDYTVLHPNFIDESYDKYASEYFLQTKNMTLLCNALQEISNSIIEYSKKFSDI